VTRGGPLTDGLTLKQERFVQEYLVDLNATQAAIRAGYSENSADVIGSENLGKPVIQGRIAAAVREQQHRTQVTADRVVRELALIAFGTLDEVAPWDEAGPHPIPSRDLPREKRALVAAIRVKRERPWRGHGQEAEAWEVEQIEVRPWDKLRALELLGKRLGLFGADQQGGHVSVTNNNLVLQQLPDDRIAALAALADKIRSES